MEEEQLAVLESFGLNGYQAKAYLALLELGPAQARDVSDRSGVPQGRVYDVLEKLHQRGLAEILPEAPRRYRAVAFETFLERELKGYHERISRLEDERERLVEAMSPARGQAAAAVERGEYVVVRGRRAVTERVAGVMDAARSDVLVLGTSRTPARLETEGARLRRLADRGVRVRLLAPMDKRNADAVRACGALGVEARHLAGLGDAFTSELQACLADGRRAVLFQRVPDDLQDIRGDDLGLAMEHPEMVRGITALAEALWAVALPAPRENGALPGVPGPGRPQAVLVVDDEPDIVQSLRELLEDSLAGVRVLTAGSGPEGMEVLRANAVDLIVTDYRLPGMNGLDFLSEAGRAAPGAQRILITAFPDLNVATGAINEAGVEHFFLKPLDNLKMVDVVRTVLRERRAQELRDAALARSLAQLGQQLRQARGDEDSGPPPA